MRQHLKTKNTGMRLGLDGGLCAIPLVIAILLLTFGRNEYLASELVTMLGLVSLVFMIMLTLFSAWGMFEYGKEALASSTGWRDEVRAIVTLLIVPNITGIASIGFMSGGITFEDGVNPGFLHLVLYYIGLVGALLIVAYLSGVVLRMRARRRME